MIDIREFTYNDFRLEQLYNCSGYHCLEAQYFSFTPRIYIGYFQERWTGGGDEPGVSFPKLPLDVTIYRHYLLVYDIAACWYSFR